MPKKLIAKTQQIKAKLAPTGKEFADTILYAPEEEEKDLEKRKGSLYGIYSLKDETPYETSLLTKLITDTLKQSYYQSENASPIQALEKAIVDTKERVLKLNGTKDVPTVLDIVAAVLWGNVFYVVKNGQGEVYIVRGGNFKKIETVKEHGFSVSTGIVKKDDVVILTTENFAKKFPPKKLLKLNPEELDGLEPSEGCLMIKFDMEETESAETIINFGLDTKGKNPLKMGADKVKKILSEREKKGLKMEITNLNFKNRDGPNKHLKFAGLAIIFLAFLGTVFWTIKSNRTANKVAEEPVESVQEEQVQETAEVTPEVTPVGETEGVEIFYDLKIADPNANPKYIELIEDTIYVADVSGTLYTSETETAKFERLQGTSCENIKGLETLEGALYIAESTDFSVYSPESESTTRYPLEIHEVFFPYLGAIYQVEEDKILKYPLNKENPEETEGALWAQTEEFRDVRDMSISISIYMLTNQGNIIRYTSGVKEGFEISGMEKELENPVALTTKWDLENMYVVDAGNNRIVVLTKEGKFVKEFVNNAWTNLKDITVSLDEAQAFVLDGSKVYLVKL